MDKNEYIAQLEAQIERANICETIGSSRLDQISGKILTIEEQMLNITHLIKLLQTNINTNETKFEKFGNELNYLKSVVGIENPEQTVNI